MAGAIALPLRWTCSSAETHLNANQTPKDRRWPGWPNLSAQFSCLPSWLNKCFVLVSALLVVAGMITAAQVNTFSSAREISSSPNLTAPALSKKQAKQLLSTASPEASDYYLRGWESYYRFTREANRQARLMFQRAIALDPEYAAAYLGLGWTHVLEWEWHWTHDSNTLERSFALAQKAHSLNDSLPYVYTLLSEIYFLRRDYDQGYGSGQNERSSS